MTKRVTIQRPKLLEDNIIIDCDHTDDLASFNLVAKDEQGLFAYIAMIFDKYGVEIQSAKIFTQKNRIRDMLLIEKNGSFCPNKEKILKEIIWRDNV
jgi:[protein-PII] uridylyltransferase